jgi:ABC-type transport system involved in multi-copper enzyme maturation permease subunit
MSDGFLTGTSRLRAVLLVTKHDVGGMVRSNRMMIMGVVIALFILGSCYAVTDARFEGLGGFDADNPITLLFLATAFALWPSTLGVVLFGFDAVSRRRLTGELAIDLTQPMPRNDLSLAHLLAVWLTSLLPTFLSFLGGILIIAYRVDAFPTIAELIVFFTATALLLWWYTCLQLFASSLARDLGSSVTLGVGTWLVFTTIWLLVSAFVASLAGVDITDIASAEFDTVNEKVDLFSPNGVYQLLLETLLPGDAQPRLADAWIWLAAIAWSVLPMSLFVHRMQRIKP